MGGRSLVSDQCKDDHPDLSESQRDCLYRARLFISLHDLDKKLKIKIYPHLTAHRPFLLRDHRRGASNYGVYWYATAEGLLTGVQRRLTKVSVG